MLLRRANIANVFESDPWVASFKKHRQHLAPHICSLQFASRLDFTSFSPSFVSRINRLKLFAESIVQIGCVRRRKQSPAAFFHHPAHEQIGNPVSCVHVVGSAAVIARVLAQLQKLFYVQVPRFEVSTNSTFAFAALVNSHRSVVNDLQKRHYTLRLAIGTFDVRTQRTNRCPVVTQATCKF